MKAWMIALAISVMSVGCVDLHVAHHHAGPPSVMPAAAIATPITADQVTPENARTMAQALWDEFDREEASSVSR